jgi:hypothetical protein
MYEIFKTAIAQMGAVGLLLSFAGLVIYWLRNDNLGKDEALKQEIAKRESLLREVLASHQDTLMAMKSLTDSQRAITDSQSVTMNRIEDITERIEAKIDAKNNSIRKN